MKRTLLLLILTGCAAILVSTGCSKKNDSQTYTNKQLAGTYHQTAWTATTAGVTVDKFKDMDACEKDDVLYLNADSTFEAVDAGTTCTINGSGTGTWVVSGNLIIIGGNDSSTIKSFNGTNLVISQLDTEQSQPVTYTTTLTKE